MPARSATPTRPLDQTAIVDAAIALIDRDGAAAFTMRQLGRELDVEAMSIYHHVPNKAALVELLVRRQSDVISQIGPSATPLEHVEQYARELRRQLLAHPDLTTLIATQLPLELARSTGARATTVALTDEGFDPEAAGWIVEAFVGFVIGDVLANLPVDDHDDAAFETGLRFLLAGLREELGL